MNYALRPITIPELLATFAVHPESWSERQQTVVTSYFKHCVTKGHIVPLPPATDVNAVNAFDLAVLQRCCWFVRRPFSFEFRWLDCRKTSEETGAFVLIKEHGPGFLQKVVCRMWDESGDRKINIETVAYDPTHIH